MKSAILFFALLLSLNYAHAQLYSDSQSILPADTNSACAALHSTRDASGNIYITGTDLGTINFTESTISLTHPAMIPYNSHEYSFIAKLISNGTWAWAQKITGVFNNANRKVFINGILPDTAGNIFMTGRFTGTAQFGNISITSTSYSSIDLHRATDIFISKMQPNGTFSWVKKEGTNIGPDFGNDIIVDPDILTALIHWNNFFYKLYLPYS